MTSLTYLPVNNRLKICGYSLQEYCKFMNTNLSQQIKTIQLKAAVALSVMGIFLKSIFLVLP